MLQEPGAGTRSAWIGPSVCGSSYEVPEDMRDHVAARGPAARCTTSRGTPGLDLTPYLMHANKLIVVDIVRSDGPAGSIRLYRRDQILQHAPQPIV